MKKAYETPEVEVVKFQYRAQVVAASGTTTCESVWVNIGVSSCVEGQKHLEHLN